MIVKDEGYKVCIVGANGNVGRNIASALVDSSLPAVEVVALGSHSSEGKKISFGDNVLTVKDIAEYDFAGTDLAFFFASNNVSKRYIQTAMSQGCHVIDGTYHSGVSDEVLTIVPEVNSHELKSVELPAIISNPSCTAVQTLAALAPLHEKFIIKRIVASTYQSVSGAGQGGIEELFSQSKGVFEAAIARGEEIGYEPEIFPAQIAFNCIPQIEQFTDTGDTQEELRIQSEIKKVLSEDIKVSVTCVRVPVFIGDAVSLNVEFQKKVTPEDAISELEECEEMIVMDTTSECRYTTHEESKYFDSVMISRIRNDKSKMNCLNMWVVVNNLRKGSALNAVRIAEVMHEMNLISIHKNV